MPFVATWPGFAVFSVVMLVFVVQEFSQGFGTPNDSTRSDDRWALIYLDALPVVLVTISLSLSLIGWLSLPMPRVVFAAGIVILVLGVAVRQWSHVSLGRFHQGVVTIHDEHQVVEDGPYRWVRHPMYAGSAVAFLGVGLSLGTYPGLVLTFVGTLPAMLRRIRVEERALEFALGERYTTFARDRRRLVPGIW
ncbi:MAG: isoprenylcysteine carboxylmethyltransferase family protein [Actinobacteria bacterium]|nr:isoprenylcysteine carboxylmethyltransferase family protein [Actinomycetota bacterium]